MKLGFIFVLMSMCSSTAFAVDGQSLHDSSCLQCHSSLTGGKPNTLYSRADKKVTTFEGLQKRVKGCAIAADVNWSDKQRARVVQYLSDQFYHF
jgi:mono/diheme cytochrome c family protein